MLNISKFAVPVLLLMAMPAMAQAPVRSEAPPPARPTPEQCDATFEECLEECDRSMPNESGEMLCTGCGWDCNVVHKKCLGGAYYRKMFGSDPTQAE